MYHRLEPLPPYADLDAGFAAEVADPLWLLGRQWQLGEHHGEDAGTPVAVSVNVAHTPIEALDGLVPSVVPPEAIIEGTTEDWWTIGRRIRAGRAIAADLTETQRVDWRLGVLPEPYGEAFADEVDGRAVWRAGAFPTDHPALAGLTTLTDAWDPTRLTHTATFPIAGSGLRLPDHDGGDVDWYSLDASTRLPRPDFVTREVIPNRLTYPGAPLPRFWQIERSAVDIGGFPPDRAHVPTTMLISLICGHADDWFTIVVPPPAPITGADGQSATPPSTGVVVTLGRVTVRSSFDERHTLTIPPSGRVLDTGRDRAPGEWSLFRTTGLHRSSLVIWPTAATPVVGPVLDDVILGVDEDANQLWAVELLADGQTLASGAEAAQALEQTRRTGSRQFTWVPSTTLPRHWHPYRLQPRSGPPRRMFVQGVVADLSKTPPDPRDGPRSELIGAGAGHEIEATAVPNQGLRLQRGYVLARTTDGQPVLWRQRRRVPVMGGPVSHLRFDLLEEA
jgi:hypothetical protein